MYNLTDVARAGVVQEMHRGAGDAPGVVQEMHQGGGARDAPEVLPTGTEVPPNRSTTSPKDKPPSTYPREIAPGDWLAFEAMWKIYPRKDGKKAAWESCLRCIKSKAGTWDELTCAATNYKADSNRGEGRYTKHGSTFFGPKEPWRDYVRGAPVTEGGQAAGAASVTEEQVKADWAEREKMEKEWKARLER